MNEVRSCGSLPCKERLEYWPSLYMISIPYTGMICCPTFRLNSMMRTGRCVRLSCCPSPCSGPFALTHRFSPTQDPNRNRPFFFFCGASRQYIVERRDDWWAMNWKGFERKRWWPNRGTYPKTSLELLTKNHKHLSPDTGCLSSNTAPNPTLSVEPWGERCPVSLSLLKQLDVSSRVVAWRGTVAA
jgi:hypothetical protein